MRNLIDLGLQLRVGPADVACRVFTADSHAIAKTLGHVIVEQALDTIELSGVLNFWAIEHKHGPLVRRWQAVARERVCM